jgi:hypothetical protein
MARASLPQRRATSRERRAVAKSPSVLRLRQRRGGREKSIATGFAWDLFLLSGVFGLPLFWRRLHAWGAVILAFWCLDLVIGRVPVSTATARAAEALLFAAFLLLQLWLGFAGNRLTARAYLAHGWEVAPPVDLATRQVIERWKLAH